MGQQVLTRGEESPAPGSSPPGCGRSLRVSRAPWLPSAAALAEQPALMVRFSPPPAHRPRQPQLRAPALDPEQLEQLALPKGWRLPTGQTISGRRPGVRAVRGGAGARAPGRRGLEDPRPKGAPPRPAPRPEGLGAGGANRGRGRFSRQGSGDGPRLFRSPSGFALVPLGAALEPGKQRT